MLKRFDHSKLSLLMLLTFGLLLILTTAPVTQAANIITVNTLADNMNNNDGKCSLREAIWSASQDANVNDCTAGSGADTIIFGVGGTIVLQSNINTGAGEVIIQGPIIISGERPSCEGGTTADCHNLLKVDVGADLTLLNVTMMDAMTSGAGGAINMVGGTLNVIGSSFIGNKSGNNGGAIRGGDVHIVGSTFTANEAGDTGGALHLNGHYERHIAGSLFNGNVAGTDGGSTGKGGAIYVDGSGSGDKDTFISDTIFNGNILTYEVTGSVSTGGGAIHNEVRDGNLIVERTAFNGNVAQNSWGGAIFNKLNANILIEDSSFNGNISGDGDTDGLGGAIHNEGQLNVSRAMFAGNIASLAGEGGALSAGNNSDAFVSNSTFFMNTAVGGKGGAIFVQKHVSLTPVVELRNVTLSDNDALQGGGIYNDSEVVRLYNSIINAGIGAGTCAGTLPENNGNNLQFPGTTCGNSITSANPLLDPPAFNGGPLASLLSMTLGAGSAALDAGNNGVCLSGPVGGTDQRGEIRPSDGDDNGSAVCDIGAVENEGLAPGFGSAPVQPGPVNIGSATVGGTVSNSFSVFEGGNAQLTLSNPTITGPHASNFTLVTAFPVVIADGAPAVDIVVSCSPTAVNSRTASLNFNTSDGSQSQVSYNLLCQGSPVPQPGFGANYLAPGPIDFDLVFLGLPKERVLTINEIGSASLTVSNPQFGGLHPGDFSLNTPFPININNGGGAVDVDLTCDPTTTGLRTATLTLTTSDPAQLTVLFNLVCTAVEQPDPPLEPGQPETGVTDAYATAISPDGQYLYVTAGNTLKQFSRAADGTLTPLITNSVPGYGTFLGVAASPDGQHVYVTSNSDDALIVYELDPATNLLTFVELYEEGGLSSGCSPCLIIDGLEGASGLTVSGDGKNVYVTSSRDDAIAMFIRNSANGELNFMGSLKDGVAGVSGLDGARDVAVTPDGAHVYVASHWGNTGSGGTLAVFGREPQVGSLTFATSYADEQGGVTELDGANGVAISPDGQQVYVTAQGDDALTVFQRESFGGTLTQIQTQVDGTRINGLDAANDVQVSPDGLYVYVAAFNDNGVSVFERLPDDGRVLYATAYIDNSSGGNNLAGPRSLVVSPDNRDIYVAANLDDSIALLQMANPIPSLNNLSPASTQAGSAAFTLTVNGTDFAAGSQIFWNGISYPTTFVNQGQVKATIPVNQVAGAGTAVITVENPTPGGGSSTNSLLFTVTAPNQNPIPSLNTAMPQGADAGSGPVTIALSGANFQPTSVVRWNGSNRPTIFIATNYLEVTVPASDLGQPGTAVLTVFNPGPGGGSSNLISFDVAAPDENPAPSLSSLTPPTAAANDPTLPGTKITLMGSNFTPDSTVLWNGSPRYTTYINESTLRISLKAADIALPNAATIQVKNPTPGGGTSNSLTFLVTAPGDNPLPLVTGFGFQATPGSGITLVIRGIGFAAGSQGLWNGSNRATIFISATEIHIQLTSAEVNADVATIQVENPAPGGGTSNLFLYRPSRVYLPMLIK